MVNKVPRRNLGADSEPWGRSVDERLLRQQGAIDLLDERSTNSFKGINSTVSGVSRNVKAVQLQQELLAEQTAALERQTDSLEKVISGLPDHQIRAGGGDLDSVSTVNTTIANMAIDIPDTHNYAWYTISNNGVFLADNTNGYLSISTEVFVDGESHGAWLQNYLYNSAYQYCSVGNTYQTAFYLKYGGKAQVRIQIWKTNSATTFSTKRLQSTFSIVSYRR